MDAIVTAGGMPQPKEPLYEATHGGYKALLDLYGKPMIQWVLDALGAAPSVGRVIVVGLPPYTNISCEKPLTILENQGEMLANIKSGVDELLINNSSEVKFLSVSSDIPSITAEMVEWSVARVEETDDDVYYNVITRQVMESRFPGSRRTYVHLKDMEVCGGDLNALRASVVNPDNALYRQLVDARKSSLRQASLLGFDTLFLLLLRRLSLAEAAQMVSKRLGVKGRAILCPYAEIGMDVDKPFQLQIVRDALAKQAVV